MSKANSFQLGKYFKASKLGQSRVTFDGPAGWSKEWMLFISDVCVSKRRQQGDGCEMIRAGIVNQTITEPYKVNEGIKLNRANYCDLTENIFFSKYKSQFRSVRVKCVCEYNGIATIESWKESAWKVSVNREDDIYEGGKVYNSKIDQWETIKNIMSNIKLAELKRKNQWMID